VVVTGRTPFAHYVVILRIEIFRKCVIIPALLSIGTTTVIVVIEYRYSSLLFYRWT